MKPRFTPILFAILAAIITAPASGAGPAARAVDIPLNVPEPDAKAGNTREPVKVYILAGQSNMVGFGRYTGTSPYDGVFLTADKNIIPGVVHVWPPRYNIIRHGIFTENNPQSPPGATLALYDGAYNAGAEYATLTPQKTGTVDLGTASAIIPGGPQTAVVTAYITVPADGQYEIHAGYKASSHNIVRLAGKQVYRKEPGKTAQRTQVALSKNKPYKVEITYMQGGSAAFWLEQVDLTGKGDLTNVTQTENAFTWLLDDQGDWRVRNDVIFAEARLAENGRWEPLSAQSNGKHMGPELGFGFVVGAWHDAQVLLIKTAMGNRSLHDDYRPPSSGRMNSDDENEGIEYRLMLKGVKTILDKIDQVVPNYKGQGYDISGFVWWQGHKDRGQSKQQYKTHMVNLIQDLRNDLHAPDMPAVIATVAFDGYNMIPAYKEIWNAQMAVADPEQTPELAGSVKTVDARGFWFPRDQSPTGTGYHYNHNAKTHLLVGDALGRAMVELQGGTAATRPVPNKPGTRLGHEQEEPTEAQLAAHTVALSPLVVDGMIPRFVADPDNRAELERILANRKPERTSQFCRDTLDYVVRHYRELDIDDYEWHPVLPDMQNGEWVYYMTDGKLPDEMQDWYEVGFDAAAAGWRTGKAPFGNNGGKMEALRPGCRSKACNCSTPPGTFWDKQHLYMRQRFTVPPRKEGYRYRVVVGGASHVNSGSGYSLYLNGKLLGRGGAVKVRQGGQPRGHIIDPDKLPASQRGELTLAVTSSLRQNARPSPRGHLSINLEMQQIPPGMP